MRRLGRLSNGFGEGNGGDERQVRAPNLRWGRRRLTPVQLIRTALANA